MANLGDTRRKCSGCGESTDDLCGGDYCEACHHDPDYPGSVSWVDCTTGTDNARALLRLGHSREEILKNYPDANI